MSRDKQIKEMAIVLSDGGCKECDCDAYGGFNCKLLYDAELLYNAGYRKATDDAREIFETIEAFMFYHENIPNEIYKSIDFNIFNKIKKKYTEEGK